MAIEHKVRLVEGLFARLEKEIKTFKSDTQLDCKIGCGKCCSKPDINASPLEFLPWAFHLFLNGKAEETLLELKNATDTNCLIFKPLALLEEYNGSCSDYSYRGLICRLFGFAANRDKYGQKRLATCTIIKEEQSENYILAQKAIDNGKQLPIFTDYYMQLTQIDYHLASILLPINDALRMAIEEVLQHYAYRPFPGGLENIA